jgi:hypothetical protein
MEAQQLNEDRTCMAIMIILGGRAVLLQVLAIAVEYRADLCILLYLVPIKVYLTEAPVSLRFFPPNSPNSCTEVLVVRGTGLDNSLRLCGYVTISFDADTISIIKIWPPASTDGDNLCHTPTPRPRQHIVYLALGRWTCQSTLAKRKR